MKQPKLKLATPPNVMNPTAMLGYTFNNVLIGSGLGIGTFIANALLGNFFGAILTSNLAAALIGGDVGKTLGIIGTTEAVASLIGSAGMVQ